MVKPVVVTVRLSRLFVESAAARISSSGRETVPSAGNGGNARFCGCAAARVSGAAPTTPTAGTATKAVSATGISSNQAMLRW